MLSEEVGIVIMALEREIKLEQLDIKRARKDGDFLSADLGEWRCDVLEYFKNALEIAATSMIGLVMTNVGDDD